MKAARVPVLDLSSLESILVKSVSMEARSAESLELSRLPWLTLSRSLASAQKKSMRQLAGELTSNIFQNTTVCNVKSFCPEIASSFCGNRAKTAIKEHVCTDIFDPK